MKTFEFMSISGVEESMEAMRLPFGSESGRRDIVSDFDITDEQQKRVYGGEWEGYNDEPISFMINDEDWELANRLSVSKGGTGHDNYLTGIRVHLKVNAPHYLWPQIQRYHWFDIVSSSSKMHTLTKEGTIAERCGGYVAPEIINFIDGLIEQYNENPNPHMYEAILENLPMGYKLTAIVSTNFLQLKNMYRQRKNHKLSHWHDDFVEFIKTMPISELITGKEKTDD